MKKQDLLNFYQSIGFSIEENETENSLSFSGKYCSNKGDISNFNFLLESKNNLDYLVKWKVNEKGISQISYYDISEIEDLIEFEKIVKE